MNTCVFELPTRRATLHLAGRLARVLRAGDLLVLDGPLGSGKTFLVRAICRSLGLPPEVPVTSPTFTLVHEHPTEPPVAHADLYRLEQPGSVGGLGLDALRAEGWLVLVEWGSQFLAELGGDGVVLRFELDPRRAVLTATGPRSAVVLNALGQC